MALKSAFGRLDRLQRKLPQPRLPSGLIHVPRSVWFSDDREPWIEAAKRRRVAAGFHGRGWALLPEPFTDVEAWSVHAVAAGAESMERMRQGTLEIWAAEDAKAERALHVAGNAPQPRSDVAVVRDEHGELVAVPRAEAEPGSGGVQIFRMRRR